MKSDLLFAFKMALLAGKDIGVQSKTENDAKILFPELVKELKDYVDSPEYQKLIQKDMGKIKKGNKK